MAKDYIFAIDLGTSAIKSVFAVSSGDKKFQILGAASIPASGMRRGVVIDSTQVANNIKTMVSQMKQLCGVKPERAIVNMGGDHLDVATNRGVVTVSRADGLISEYDVERVVASSQALSLPLNRETIQIIPKEFIVDGERQMKNVVGMHGLRLELEALIVHAFSPHLKTLNRTFSEAGVELGGLVISGLAGALSTLSEQQKEIGCVLIDIGAQTTDIVVFEQGQPVHIAVLPIGSFHVSNDVAIGLRIDFDVAERLKVEYGHCDPEAVSRKEIITSGMMGFPEDWSFSRKTLTEIIEARFSEIFDLVNKELRKIGREALLPGGAILIGGGAKSAGVIDFAKKRLRLPVRLGSIQNVEGLMGRIDEVLFATAVGLAKWETELPGDKNLFDKSSAFGSIGGAFKKIMRGFLP